MELVSNQSIKMEKLGIWFKYGMMDQVSLDGGVQIVKMIRMSIDTIMVMNVLMTMPLISSMTMFKEISNFKNRMTRTRK